MTDFDHDAWTELGLLRQALSQEGACGICGEDPIDGRNCQSTAPHGPWVCTRDRGHAGPHVACCGHVHMRAWWHQGDDPQVVVPAVWREASR